MSLAAGTTVSLGGYAAAASAPSTSSLPFSYSPAADAFAGSGSGSGYEEGASGGRPRFDRAPQGEKMLIENQMLFGSTYDIFGWSLLLENL